MKHLSFTCSGCVCVRQIRWPWSNVNSLVWCVFTLIVSHLRLLLITCLYLICITLSYDLVPFRFHCFQTWNKNMWTNLFHTASWQQSGLPAMKKTRLASKTLSLWDDAREHWESGVPVSWQWWWDNEGRLPASWLHCSSGCSGTPMIPQPRARQRWLWTPPRRVSGQWSPESVKEHSAFHHVVLMMCLGF